MEKKVLYGLVVMLMYLVDSGFSQGEVNWTSEEEAKWEELLSKAQLPILVTVTSSLCGIRCALLEEQVSQLAKTYGNRIIFYKADILEKPFFAKRYNIVNIPTLIVFKDGKELKRLEKDFYWGAVYDFIFRSNIFYSASAPASAPATAPTPSDSAPTEAPSDSPPPFNESEDTIGGLSWNYTVVETQLPIVLTITSLSCGVPCVILKEQVARLAETYGKQIFFYTADILEKPFFKQLYNIVNVPTVIVIKDGKEIFRYEKLSDWGNLYDLIFQSHVMDTYGAPTPSDSPSPLAAQSGVSIIVPPLN